MKTIALVNGLVCAIVSCIVIFIGLDLKKWSSWLFCLYGFLSGFLFGFAWAGVLVGLQGGAIFVFIVICGGAMTRWQRQHYTKAAESWLSRFGQEKHLSILARIIRRLQNK